jgi:SnoaL-like domain
VIDEDKMAHTIAERLERTTNPRHRHNLEALLQHVTGEAERDVDKVMASMAPDPVYRIWGAPESMSPRGFEGVREFYERRLLEGERFWMEVDIEYLVVDDDTILTDSVLTSAVPGWYLADPASYPFGGLDVDPDGWYLMRYRMATIWPFVDGLIRGEEGYIFNLDVRPLTAEELAQVPEAVRA